MGSNTFSFSWILIICIAMLALAADQGISVSSPPNSDVDLPEKANVIDCRAALLSIGDCYLEFSRAFRTGQVRIFLGPTCCRAAQELNSWCWPNVFGVNPYFPSILEFYCSRFQVGRPPFGAAVEPVPETGDHN